MKSDYRVRAMRFLNIVLPYIKNVMTSPWDFEQAIKKFHRDRSRRVVVSYGSARIALITSDYVVKWDYDEDCVREIGGCDDEFMAYKKAVAAGYGYLLAESYLVDVHGIHFNIMPRIRNVGPHGNKDISDFLTFDEFNWLYGFNKDLHNYNWGIRHNRPVVIDYAMTEEVLERTGY